MEAGGKFLNAEGEAPTTCARALHHAAPAGSREVGGGRRGRGNCMLREKHPGHHVPLLCICSWGPGAGLCWLGPYRWAAGWMKRLAAF